MKYYFFSYTYRDSDDPFDFPLRSGSIVIKASRIDIAHSGFNERIEKTDARYVTIILVFSEPV